MSARIRLTAAAAAATLLAALSLRPAMETGMWFWVVAAAVAAVACGAALGRRLGLPRPLVPLLALLALVGTLTMLYARGVAVLAVLPGPAAWRVLVDLAGQGFDTIQGSVPPAPVVSGLVLVVAAGVGLAAVVVDTLGVTYRSAALAGIPLLALYAVPVAVVREGVPVLLFLAAALGWLGLLLAEGRERLSGWGRLLRQRRTSDAALTASATGAPLGAVGRRIGAVAVGLAVVVPALVPGLEEGVWRRGGNGLGEGEGTGAPTVVTINPYVTLRGELEAPVDSEVLRYRIEEGNPDYLRLVTLDTFDGRNWRPAALTRDRRATATLPDPTGLGDDVDRDEVRLFFRLTGLDQTWLPLTFPPTQIRDLEGSWSFDDDTSNVFSPRTRSVGATYVVTGLRLRPTTEQLRSAGTAPAEVRARYLRLPADLPPEIAETARRATAGATTDFDRAEALQRFFRTPANGFRYSTTVPPFEGSPLVGFLRNREGFCQQYASAFAVMARTLGLPARVNVGFTRGSRSGDGSEYIVSRRDAHAWPEVYLDGVGWVRFEPTPGGVGLTTPPYAVAGTGTTGGPTPSASASPSASGQRRQLPSEDGVLPQGGGPNGLSGRAVGTAAVIGALIGLLLAAPALVRIARRRRRLRSAATDTPAGVEAAWHELAATCADLGAPWPSSRTPRQTAATLAGPLPEGPAAAVRRLARRVERVRYAPAAGDLSGVADDLTTAVEGLESAAPRGRRRRARLLPPSVLTAAADRVAEALDWVDTLGARTRARLQARVRSWPLLRRRPRGGPGRPGRRPAPSR